MKGLIRSGITPAADQSQPSRARTAVRLSIALAVFAVGVLASLLASWQVHRTIQEQAQVRFHAVCDEITARINARLAAYALMLQGGRALFTASDDVRRDEWKTYYDVLDAKRAVPGYLAVGFIEWVPAAKLDDHVARTRRSGLTEYVVHPAGRRDDYGPVVFIEPFTAANIPASGFDMHSEPVRRAAMDKACDTGEAALTAKLTLVQDGDSGEDPGAVMYVPVFRNSATTATATERRKALVGWVFCAFRLRELMAGVLPDWLNAARNAVALQIYDGDDPSRRNLLFASRPVAKPDPGAVLECQRRIDFQGHSWLIVFAANGAHEGAGPAGLATGAAGLLISGLVLGLMLTGFKRLDAQRRAEELAAQVSEMAFHDSLTALPNRLLLLDRLEMAIAVCTRSGGHGALMMVDLDNFKPLNDTHGHAAGDLLIIEVAGRLRNCVRRTDTLARLGGDEFIVLLPSLAGDARAAVAEAVAVAGKILEALSHPYVLAGEDEGVAAITHSCSSSIGVTIFGGNETDPATILRRADAAMYEAKRAGRNRVSVAGAAGSATAGPR